MSVLLTATAAFPQDTPSGPVSLKQEYQQARSLFYQEQYSKAEPQFRSLIKTSDSQVITRKSHYFLGRVLMEQQKQPIEALKHFDTVLDAPPDYLSDDSLYFVASILIEQMNQVPMALPYLKTVTTHFPNSDFYDRAQKKLNSSTENRQQPVQAYDKDAIPTPRIQLNFEKVDLKDFISAYSKLSGKNFIYRPNVSGKVTILSPEGFPIYNLFDVFINILETRNYTAIQKEDHYLVKRIQNALRGGIGVTESPSGLQTKLYPLEGLHWNDVKRTLNVILPRRKNLLRLNNFNEVLVTAPPAVHEQVTTVLSQLRQSPESGIIHYKPQHVSSSRLSNRLNSFLPTFIDKNSFQLTPLKKNNTILITLPESRKPLVNNLLKKFDGNMVDRLNVRTVSLEHAKANVVANKLQQLTNVLPGNFKTQNIQVVPDKRQNAVIVSSTSDKAINIVEDAIKRLDTPSPQQPKMVRVYPLKYTDEKVMADQLKNLSNLLPGSFPNKNIQIVPTSQQAIIVAAENKKVFPIVERIINRIDRLSKNSPKNIQVYRLNHADAEKVVSKLKKLIKNLSGKIPPDEVTLLPDKRQQAVVVSAQSRDYLPIIERAIKQLDQQTAATTSKFHVYKLHNAKAGPLAEKLNFLVKGTGVGEQIKITADEQSNSLVISAPSDQYQTLKTVINRLDNPKTQILVDVYIVESSRDNARQLGIEWTIDGEVDGRPVTGGTNYGLRPQFRQGSLFGLSAGIFDRQGQNLVGVLSAYAEKSGFKIISTSHLVANENEEASLSVGEIVPILQESQVTEGGSLNRSFTFKNVGVDLTMTPTLSGDSEVTLDLRQQIQELQSTGSELGAPVRRNREIQTRVSITQDKTLVLGGVLSKQSSRTNRSIPYLNQVPLLNYLVSNMDNQSQRRNLLIFIQPHIIGTDTGIQQATERLRKKQKQRLDSDTTVGFDELQEILKREETADTKYSMQKPDSTALSETESRRIRQQFRNRRQESSPDTSTAPERRPAARDQSDTNQP
jgi:general secretion pathway protein D